jgi:tetratricopeptide (TPR) repeat protein
MMLMNNLAFGYDWVGRIDKACELYGEACELMRSKLGEDHPMTLTANAGLAWTFRAQGQIDESIRLYKQTLRRQRDALGIAHADTFNSLKHLADIHLSHQNYASVETIIRRWIAEFEQLPTMPARKLATCQMWLAAALLGLQQPVESGAAAQAAIEFFETSDQGEDQIHLQRARNILGGVLVQQQQWQQAEPLLTESYRELKHKLTDLNPLSRWQVRTACRRVVDLYQSWEREEEVATWLDELQRIDNEIMEAVPRSD